MASTPKRHWYQDRPADDLNDMDLARCSLAARGAFLVLRSFIRLHCQETPGWLVRHGKPLELREVSFLCYVEHSALEAAVRELLDKGVARQAVDGALELPREIASFEDYQRQREHGARRWQKADPQGPPQGPPSRPPQGPPQGGPLGWLQAPLEAPLEVTRARADGSGSRSGSGSEALEGGAGGEADAEVQSSKLKAQGEDMEEPHIPSLEEFTDAFLADGIPAEYLREKWEWFEGNRAWLTKDGTKLKNWRVLVRGWWRADRATWRPSKAAVAANPQAQLSALQSALDAATDPAERVRLMKQMNVVGQQLQKPAQMKE